MKKIKYRDIINTVRNPSGHTDFYATLGVPENASAEEIKRAYYRLVRKHQPEKDPDGYQRIRMAFETLGNRDARKEYDAMRQFGDEIVGLLGEALRDMEKENFVESARLFRRILILNPYARSARDLLGICLSKLGEYNEAENIYRLLTESNPDIALYYIRYGDVLRSRANEEESWSMGDILHHARQQYRKAIEIDRINQTPYLSIARTYMTQAHFAKAIAWCENAIKADDEVRFDDFDAFFLMVRIHIQAGNPHLVMEVARRIEDTTPADREIRKYVASRFALDGFELLKIKAFEPASYLLKVAIKFDPGDSELEDLQGNVELAYLGNRAWPQLEKDESIIDPIKFLALTILSKHCGEQLEESYDIIVERILKSLATYNRSVILASIKNLQERYPFYYDMNSTAWDGIKKQADPVRKAIPMAPQVVKKTARKPEEDMILKTSLDIDSERIWGALRVIGGPLIGKLIVLNKTEMTIGRSHECDIVLSDKYISRRHGIIRILSDGSVRYKDRSLNGTKVNGKLINKREVKLGKHSVIEIGFCQMKLGNVAGWVKGPEIEVQPEPAHVSAKKPRIKVKHNVPVRDKENIQGLKLEVIRGNGDAGKTYSVIGETTRIGRARDQDFILESGFVSRRHAVITRTNGSFILENLSKTVQGTRLNGKQVEGFVTIRPGDLISIASLEIVVK